MSKRIEESRRSLS